MIRRRVVTLAIALAGWGGVLLLIVPVVYACWISFSHSSTLVPPSGDWSLRWYRALFADRRWTAALGNSFRIAILSVAMALVTGLPLTYALARCRFRGQSFLGIGVLLPLAVPPVVLGVGLLPAVHALGLWGSTISLALAHALFGLPVACVLVRSALLSAGSELEWAARGLGASAARAFWRVTFPLIRPAVLGGALVAFILSINDFILALFLATPETETLPRVLWPQLRYAMSPIAAAASGIVTVLTVAAAALAGGLWRRFR
jgi:ABC-type spermidine/putrescine transport system permease subunit II